MPDSAGLWHSTRPVQWRYTVCQTERFLPMSAPYLSVLHSPVNRFNGPTSSMAITQIMSVALLIVITGSSGPRRFTRVVACFSNAAIYRCRITLIKGGRALVQ